MKPVADLRFEAGGGRPRGGNRTTVRGFLFLQFALSFFFIVLVMKLVRSPTFLWLPEAIKTLSEGVLELLERLRIMPMLAVARAGLKLSLEVFYVKTRDKSWCKCSSAEWFYIGVHGRSKSS
ncbi:hypothetical protein V6N13_048833 [Hibiscus sabdariffa]